MTTILLALLITGPTARPDTGETSLLPSVTGTVFLQWMDDSNYYYTHPDTIVVGYWYNVYPPCYVRWHGWLRFDLTAVPDSAEFDGAALHFYMYNDTFNPPWYWLTGFRGYRGAEDSLYYAVLNSTPISDTLGTQRGWNSVELDPPGLELLRDCLPGDTMYLGIRCTGGLSEGSIWGLHGPDSLRPHLELTWHTAVREPRGPAPARPEFYVTPNPTPGRTSVNYSLPYAGTSVLSLLDISGREVWTKRLAGEHTGAVQLPFLPAGVYLVRLQSASLTATGKLVVQK